MRSAWRASPSRPRCAASLRRRRRWSDRACCREPSRRSWWPKRRRSSQGRFQPAGDGSPLVVLSLFRHRSFVVGLGVGVSFFSGLAPFLVLLAEYLQRGLDLTPRAAGLRFLPFGIGFLSASFASARLAPRLGRAILQLGAGLIVTGLLTLTS